MRLLTRYVLADLLKVFLLSLFCLTTVIMIGLGGKRVVEEGLGLITFLRILPYILPEALRFAVPGTMLLAATNAYGRMAASNEVVAVKSLGISPMVLIRPLLLLAAFISLANVLINDLAVSWGREGVRRVIIQSGEQIVYGVLESQGRLSTPNMTIIVKGVEGKRLIHPTLILNETDSRPATTIIAEEARLHSNLEQGMLEIECRNTQVDSGSSFKGTFPETEVLPLPLGDVLQRGGGNLSSTDQSLRKIPEEIERRKHEVVALREELASTAVYQMIAGDFDDLSDSSWEHSRLRLANAEKMIHRLRTECPRRWADGFSCLCFAMVGAPMAIRLRRGEFLEVFFACFLPILVVYYPLLYVGLYQAKNGLWPPSCVWLGNLFFALWGVWMLRGVLRN